MAAAAILDFENVGLLGFGRFQKGQYASVCQISRRPVKLLLRYGDDARPSVVSRLSVVCNVRAPYSGGCNFYGIWYLGHPLTPTENFMEIVPGENIRRGS